MDDNYKDPSQEQDTAPNAAENGTPQTDDEKSVMEFAKDAFNSAKKAAIAAADKAQAYIQEKADQTDLDEKATEFVKNASDTAKNAFDTAADKTKAFVEQNDLDDKAKAFAQDVSKKATEWGSVISGHAKEFAENAKKFFEDLTDDDDETDDHDDTPPQA